MDHPEEAVDILIRYHLELTDNQSLLIGLKPKDQLLFSEKPSRRGSGGSVSLWAHYNSIESRLRDYWYLILESRRLRKKPVVLQLFGKKDLLIRDRERAHALESVGLTSSKRSMKQTLSLVLSARERCASVLLTSPMSLKNSSTLRSIERAPCAT